MKFVRTLKYAGPALLSLLFAAPAIAQFEVNPDHFDNSQASTQKKPAPKIKAQQVLPGAGKQSAKRKSSKNSATTSNNKAAQPAGQAKATTTTTKAASKVQSQTKTRTSPPLQRLSANATAISRE